MSAQSLNNDEERLAQLFSRWKKSYQQGIELSLEQICEDCPELLNEFRLILPSLSAINNLFEAAPDDPLSTAAVVGDIAEYRALHFHREGGLGLVLVGEDPELQRRVAIKRLKPQQKPNAKAKERFLAEAEVTARLDHPGVVPIYRAGADSLGQPYYSMRFIEGETLGEAIRRFHVDFSSNPKHAAAQVEFRRLIRGIVQVCQTIGFAHSRGIVHRDIKPENVMLGAYGEVLIVDWGLAKRIDLTNDDFSAGLTYSQMRGGETLLGEIKGSPEFMSPEQASGEPSKVGVSSDVYSLGATLYVLLTGQAPYRGDNSHAIIAQVKTGVFVRPEVKNPRIPKSLAAVCSKAMSLKPEERYSSALALAEELEKWAADEPVTALREPLLHRMARWGRKHRTFTVGTILALFLTSIGAGLFALQQSRRAIREAEFNEQLSENYATLIQVVIASGTEDESMGEPSEVLLGALSKAKTHFTTLANAENPKAMLELAVIENSTGMMHLRHGRPEAAAPHFQQAIIHLQRARERTEEVHADELLATISTNLGVTLMQRMHLDEAIAQFERSLKTLGVLSNSRGESISTRHASELARLGLGNAFHAKGTLQWQAKQFADADKSFKTARTYLEPLSTRAKPLPGANHVYPSLLLHWAQMLDQYSAVIYLEGAERASDAIALIEKSLAIRDELQNLKPADPKALEWLSNQKALNETHELLAWACQERLKQLDTTSVADRDAVQRLIQTGLSALKSLPTSIQNRGDLTELMKDFQLRQRALSFGRSEN